MLWVVTYDSVLTNLYCEGSITDTYGNSVTIQAADVSILAEGTSEFTITVVSYDTCDLSGTGMVSTWESHTVDF